MRRTWWFINPNAVSARDLCRQGNCNAARIAVRFDQADVRRQRRPRRHHAVLVRFVAGMA